MAIVKYLRALLVAGDPDSNNILYVCDTDAEKPGSGMTAGDMVVSLDTGQFYIALSATTLMEIGSAGITRIAGSSGAAGSGITLQRLTADSSSITSTTPTVVMTTTGLGVGVWHFRYVVIYQSAATGTGISFVVNHTGTVTEYVKTWHHVTTGGAASTGVGDDVAGTNTGQIVEGHANTANNGDEGPTAGVAAANTDVMAVVEGFITVSVSGDLELKIRTETGGTGVLLKAASHLHLTKVS